MRRTGAVIHRTRLDFLNRLANRETIQHIDGLPADSVLIGAFSRRWRSAGPMPGDDLRALRREEIEHMASGEPGSAGYQRGT